ncbi:MAG: hypothetical protein H7Y27_02985 [Gemmatimonadaceae bacterium]|nr:hypothetical protein [Chitinophagaceae bacterium]
MHFRTYTAASFFAILLLSAGCRKDGAGAKTALTPKQYERGIANGTPVVKNIGTTGGTISSADGRISVEIPAGAVDQAIDFSITPLTNTIPISSGDSYRLQPENIAFKKPVKVTLQYSAADLKGTSEEAMYLAYQGNDGIWKLVKHSEVNKTNGTVSVQTTHFSDWGIVEDFRVLVEKETVNLGESIVLVLQKLVTAEDDSLLAPLADPEEFDFSDKVKWRVVSNAGTINAALKTARYTAPATMPAANPVIIETAISNIPIKNPVTGRFYPNGKLLILSPIKISGGSIVTLSYRGSDYVYTNVTIGYANGKITVQGVDANGAGINLTGNSNRATSFPFGDLLAPGKGQAHINIGPYGFSTEYTKCNISETFYSSGAFVVSKWADVGERVEGSFSGNVYSRNPPGTTCPAEAEKRTFSGEFAGVRLY